MESFSFHRFLKYIIKKYGEVMKYLTLVLMALILSACGSEDAEQREIYGLWQLNEESEDTYLAFSAEGVKIYIYNDYFSCFRERVNDVIYIDSRNEFKIVFSETDIRTFNYEIDNLILTLDEGSSYTKRNTSESQIESCANPALSGRIEVAITFDDLPSDIELSDYSEFLIDLSFDVNDSEDFSGEDIGFEFWGLSLEEDGSDAIEMENLQSLSYLYVEDDSESSGPDDQIILATLNYNISGNVFTFTIDRSVHKAYSNIDATTPFTIEAYIAKELGIFNRDSFPDEGYVLPASGLLDGSNDISYSNQNNLGLDILNVSVFVTEE
jgi:hypothetical protein